MPSFEISKLQGVPPARGLSESDRSQLDATRMASVRRAEASAGKSGIAIEVGPSIDASRPPVDTERVAKIRKALEDGTYPLVPTKIADAIIAARVGFGVAGK